MKYGAQKSLIYGLFVAAFLFCAMGTALAIILHTNDQPTDRPPDEVVGSWDNASCVVISPNHVLTTRHQIDPDTIIVEITGTNYRVAGISNIGSADLRVAQITTMDCQLANLSDYVPLYTIANEANEPSGVMGGFGKVRGADLQTDGITYGYAWASNPNGLLWGSNKVNGYYTAGGDYTSEVIWGDFDGIGEGGHIPCEAALALHDSGGGWFIKDGAEWKVAGLFRGAEQHSGQTWFRNRDDPNILDPDLFDAVRVSSYHEDITDATIPPAIPVTVVSQTGNKCGQIALSWDTSEGATGYRIYYQEDSPGPPFEPIQNGNPPSTSDLGDVNELTVTDLSPGMIYYFAVTAYKNIAESNYSSQTNAVVSSYLVDDFNDNIRGANWRLNEDSHNSAWLTETNQRLEFRADIDANNIKAVYASNGWKSDSTNDFSLKVDFHHELVTEQDSRLFIRLDPNSNGDNYISFDAGCDANGPYWRYEKVIDGDVASTAQTHRDSNDGTLYISYDASLDELYLSHIGYGSGSAWQIISELLQGQWAGEPVYVHIGGGSQNVAISSGQSHLDNFTVNNGVLPDWPPATDINNDGFIDWLDIEVISEQWLKTREDLEPCCEHLDADINGDNTVNLEDFAAFANVW